jgi:glycerol-3-phosphate cytidylyltransferase
MGIVYTGGTFDLIHSGHIRFLKACKRISGVNGRVVVSLNTDAFVEQYKAFKPIMSFDERAELLLGTKYVDEVVANEFGADSKPTILEVLPNFIVIGDDWAKKDYYAQMQFTQGWLDAHKIQLVYVPYTPGISTTELKKRIVASQVK